LRGQWSGRPLFRSSITRASLLFFWVAVASNALGGEGWSHESSRSLYDLASYIGFFLMLVAWVDSRQRMQKVLSILLYSTIGAAVFAIFQEISGGYTSLWVRLSPSGEGFPPWNSRATSFLNYSNSLAGYLNLVLPFALACFVLGRSKWKMIGGWTLGLGLLALLSTQSVGGLVAFVSILVLAILCFARSSKKRLVLLVGVSASVCLLYLLRNILNPAHTEQSFGPDLAARLLLWGTAWDLFRHSPIIGVGWGNFVGLYGLELFSFSDWVPQGVFEVHNIYLQLLAETGLVGFMAFFYLFLQSWRMAWGQLRSSPDFLSLALAFGLLGALLSVMVHGFVDFLFQVSPQFGALFWVLLALLVANGRVGRSRQGYERRVIAAQVTASPESVRDKATND